MVVRKDKAVNDEVHEVLFVCFFFVIYYLFHICCPIWFRGSLSLKIVFAYYYRCGLFPQGFVL